jgi:hypothetical protein
MGEDAVLDALDLHEGALVQALGHQEQTSAVKAKGLEQSPALAHEHEQIAFE